MTGETNRDIPWDDGGWAMEILAKDDLFSQMTLKDQRRIIAESADFGAHLAEKTREKVGIPAGADSIRKMLVSLGCGVRVDEENGLPGPMSEYAEDLLTARFFTVRIRQQAAAAADKGEWSSGWYELYEQCLSREIFHHVENTLSGKASHHVRFKAKLLGLLPVSRPVETAGRIAVMVFVRDFLGLGSIPTLLQKDLFSR